MKKFNLLLAFLMVFYAQSQAQISLGFKARPILQVVASNFVSLLGF